MVLASRRCTVFSSVYVTEQGNFFLSNLRTTGVAAFGASTANSWTDKFVFFLSVCVSLSTRPEPTGKCNRQKLRLGSLTLFHIAKAVWIGTKDAKNMGTCITAQCISVSLLLSIFQTNWTDLLPCRPAKRIKKTSILTNPNLQMENRRKRPEEELKWAKEVMLFSLPSKFDKLPTRGPTISFKLDAVGLTGHFDAAFLRECLDCWCREERHTTRK